jgi:hypothetical protein
MQGSFGEQESDGVNVPFGASLRDTFSVSPSGVKDIPQFFPASTTFLT